jgi:hypothetical protein
MRALSDLPKIDGYQFVGITTDGARLACRVFVARGGVIECRAATTSAKTSKDGRQ